MPDTTNPGTPEDVLPGGARPRRSTRLAVSGGRAPWIWNSPHRRG
jgi:hypothetical protein